jgi:hypothetical protein
MVCVCVIYYGLHSDYRYLIQLSTIVIMKVMAQPIKNQKLNIQEHNSVLLQVLTMC